MKDHVFYASLKATYPVIDRGEGVYLWDTSGKRYLDGCSGALVANIGHGVKEVADAIDRQLRRVAFAHRSQFTSGPLISLAELIAEMAPPGMNWVNFVSGGSEATETAMKMAREYYIERGKPAKYQVVARWQSYHGNSIGALSMSGHIGRRRRYAPMLVDFPHAVPAYCYRCPFDKRPENCALECAADIERAIVSAGPENVAAVIIEPVVGSSLGAVPAPDGYLQAVRDTCTKYDVLLIADEVMTGFGRTGANFGVDHWKVVPDMIVCAKGASGGYAPLGAVVLTDEVHRAFREGSGKFAHGFTYGGNPVAAAAGVAVLEYLKNHDLVNASLERGRYLMAGLKRLQESCSMVGDVRGMGLMTGIEFVSDRRTKEPFPVKSGVTDMVKSVAFSKGLILYPAPGCADGVRGDTVMVAPPLVIKDSEIDELLAIIEETLREIEARVPGLEKRT